MADTAVVVGGGLAGIAAALRLSDAGRSVTLLERRPRLGGAAFSFRRGELTIDNGQHVFLRCCTAYRELIERLGATDLVTVQDRLDIPVLKAGGGRTAHLRRSRGIPAPLHLTAALARYALLSPPDRARAARGALALRSLDPDDRSLDALTLGDFLRRHGQNDATIDRLWGIIAVATLNLRPDDASLALAAKVFRTGLLDAAEAADVGYAAVPLGDLHSTAAERALTAAGVEVLTGHRVDLVAPAGSGVTVEATGPTGQRSWSADRVVLATPPAEAFAAAPGLESTDAAPAQGLGASPIVNVHVIYDRVVTELPFAAAVSSPVQWIFDRTEPSTVRNQHRQAQYLAITVSAADALIDTPSRVLTDQFEAELAALLPGTERANVIDSFVTRERRATFRQAAGTWRMRPSAASGLPGVWLAGAWTDTGWPDTMESAVRSGNAAAEAALRAPLSATAESGTSGVTS
ncbi:MAG TPA: hydroxysqualene dehydroxylase HpnE [Jatrophihabitantaceae bacterium]|jgi:squalene-associated FAD-dependent desaturase|nr:hydroxysqualene dehydroxylase HpnE [Jatrophihabitantaceae bacterium]